MDSSKDLRHEASFSILGGGRVRSGKFFMKLAYYWLARILISCLRLVKHQSILLYIW